MNNTTKSVDVQQFDSGAVRDKQGHKSRPDLISPFAEGRLADWLALGAQKYDDRNWELGIPNSRCMASALRHLLAYRQGKTDEDHLAAAYCNLHFMLHNEEMIKLGVLPETIDDMPRYVGVYAEK